MGWKLLDCGRGFLLASESHHAFIGCLGDQEVDTVLDLALMGLIEGQGTGHHTPIYIERDQP